MADQPASEKTEQPTPRRLEKARDEGKVPQSQELAGAVTLLSLLLSLAVLAPSLLQWFERKVEWGLAAGPVTAFSDVPAFLRMVHQNTIDLIVVLLPIFTVLAVAGVVASLAVGGLTFTPAALRLRWEEINPAHTIPNLISQRAAVRLLASILKLFFVSIIVWLYLNDQLPALAALRWAWSAEIMAATAKIIFGLGLRVGLAIAVIGLADALYQKWQHTQELKMTRQEVKQERKDTEGAPEIKARIRRIQVEMSMRRLKQQVPKANVILVNPTHVAVALRYDAKTMEAPMLLAKGADLMAQRIVTIARSYGIPIVQRPEVARTIYANVKPGQPIPEALYMAVAEVLAMLYRLRQKKRGGK
ncbi:MAG: flagellar biosynthesis protein FlhB [Phycisphaerae bacterium]|nr:flagellar biosynthesis protein FlhB [Phycisphaerae bacterium]